MPLVLDPLRRYSQQEIGTGPESRKWIFDQGFWAADAGHPITACPYPDGTDKLFWIDGYRAWTVQQS
jgi:hypothetical protein